MALVGYSDSEGSDAEDTTPLPPKTVTPKISKPAQSKPDATAPRKIQVNLPTATTTEDTQNDRPIKRARIAGGLGGINLFLPAPKRTAEAAKKSGLGSGVSLRTSANAAFSRERAEPEPESIPIQESETLGGLESIPPVDEDAPKVAAEIKTVGNAMRFKPLSVANKKKSKKRIISGMTETSMAAASKTEEIPQAPAPPPPKPKVSLFSVTQDESEPEASTTTMTSSYEPILSNAIAPEIAASDTTTAQSSQPPSSNSLDAIASDLNLSAADRRRLFGRTGKGDSSAINIANFNMDNEYAKNEEMRAAGETMQHRAVKSIAPGKHSLQQLLNSASSQKEALEDAWAEGKRAKGEAGGRYGW